MRIVVALPAMLLLSSPALAQDEASDDYLAVDVIHSDLPLYGFDWEDLWPRSYSSSESFGCLTRVAFGDWKFTPHADNEYEEPSWYRFSNYGAHHCAAILSQADTKEDLEEAHWEYGLIVKLGEVGEGSELTELWAIQKGMRPGSSYTLLARTPDAQGLVAEFTFLQQKCPKDRVREIEGFSMDVWSTAYCAINSRDELLALATAMAAIKPLGTITLALNEKGPDEMPDPSE